MTWELTRRRFTRAINSKYLFDRVVSLSWPRLSFLGALSSLTRCRHLDHNGTALTLLMSCCPASASHFFTTTNLQNTLKIRYSELTVLRIHLQPLLHAIIFLIEMTLVARLVARYNAFYAERPGMCQSCQSSPRAPPFIVHQPKTSALWSHDTGLKATFVLTIPSSHHDGDQRHLGRHRRHRRTVNHCCPPARP